MSGVILRCPNCGTGRPTPGECDACHEADARYYCTNHTPGLWLEDKACARCGAKFGQPTPAPTPAPAPAPRPARPAPAPARAPSLEELLAAAARAREAAPPPMDAGMDPRTSTRGMGGCLVRAIVLLFVFILMVFSGMFMFAGSMFRVW